VNAKHGYEIAKGQHLDINIDNIGPFGIVSLHAVPPGPEGSTDPIVVKTWALTFSAQATRNVRDPGKIRSITPFPDEAIAFSGTALDINGKWASDKDLAVFIAAPQGTSITLYVNGKILHQGPFLQNALIRGPEIVEGSVNASEPVAIALAMQAAGLKERVPLDPDAIRPPSRPGEALTLPWKKLARLNVGGKIPLNIPSNVSSKQTWAFVEVFVDESGRVSKASPKPFGNTELARAVAQALTQWQFQPFVFESRLVKVRSTIPVALVDGKILLQEN
jgi:hypothetical protein